MTVHKCACVCVCVAASQFKIEIIYNSLDTSKSIQAGSSAKRNILRIVRYDAPRNRSSFKTATRSQHEWDAICLYLLSAIHSITFRLHSRIVDANGCNKITFPTANEGIKQALACVLSGSSLNAPFKIWSKFPLTRMSGKYAKQFFMVKASVVGQNQAKMCVSCAGYHAFWHRIVSVRAWMLWFDLVKLSFLFFGLIISVYLYSSFSFLTHKEFFMRRDMLLKSLSNAAKAIETELNSWLWPFRNARRGRKWAKDAKGEIWRSLVRTHEASFEKCELTDMNIIQTTNLNNNHGILTKNLK